MAASGLPRGPLCRRLILWPLLVRRRTKPMRALQLSANGSRKGSPGKPIDRFAVAVDTASMTRITRAVSECTRTSTKAMITVATLIGRAVRPTTSKYKRSSDCFSGSVLRHAALSSRDQTCWRGWSGAPSSHGDGCGARSCLVCSFYTSTLTERGDETAVMRYITTNSPGNTPINPDKRIANSNQTAEGSVSRSHWLGGVQDNVSKAACRRQRGGQDAPVALHPPSTYHK